MKVLKTASGNKIKLSRKEWESIGKKAGWMKAAALFDAFNKKKQMGQLSERVVAIDVIVGLLKGYYGHSWFEQDTPQSMSLRELSPGKTIVFQQFGNPDVVVTKKSDDSYLLEEYEATNTARDNRGNFYQTEYSLSSSSGARRS